MKNKIFTKSGFIKYLLFALSLFIIYTPNASASGEKVKLSGAKAVEHLKQNGQYDALVEAVKKSSGDPENAVQPIASKITASDKEADDFFGFSVAVSGNRAVVGAIYDDINGVSNQGSVYVFRLVGANWVQEAKLTAADGATDDVFGYSVDIDGNFIIVGTRDDVGVNADQGSVYLYQLVGSSWSPIGKILAPDGEAGDLFGYRVAVSGNVFAVSAPYDNLGANSNVGSVYIISFVGGTGWAVETKIIAPDGAASDLFGNTVDIFGNTIIAGAPGDDTNRGSAYFFERTGGNWVYKQKVTVGDGAPGDNFGAWVAIRGNYAIVGAPGDDVGGNQDQGSAYTFRKTGTTWSFNGQLIATDGAAGDQFGRSVGLTDAGFIAGAYQDDIGANTDQGSAYIFRLNGIQKAKLAANDGAAEDTFGYAVAADDAKYFVGANYDSTAPVINHGSAYIFTDNVKFDFDGDGRSDIGVFRPSSNVWHLSYSSNGNYVPTQFGASGDLLAPSDYDGDGRTDIAVFRPSNGTWYWLNSSNNTVGALAWGQNGDVPVPAFFRDGDVRADPTVFRPSNGTWYIYRSNGGGFTAIQFGTNGDIPIPADYFGEGLDNIGVFRPSDGTWYLRGSNGSLTAIQWGMNGDTPVPADYDGDGKTDVAVVRASSGFAPAALNNVWYILLSSGGFQAVQWGISSDIPAAADYDGDGNANITVFRPSNGNWYSRNSDGTFRATLFGGSGDQPIPAAFTGE